MKYGLQGELVFVNGTDKQKLYVPAVAWIVSRHLTDQKVSTRLEVAAHYPHLAKTGTHLEVASVLSAEARLEAAKWTPVSFRPKDPQLAQILTQECATYMGQNPDNYGTSTPERRIHRVRIDEWLKGWANDLCWEPLQGFTNSAKLLERLHDAGHIELHTESALSEWLTAEAQKYDRERGPEAPSTAEPTSLDGVGAPNPNPLPDPMIAASTAANLIQEASPFSSDAPLRSETDRFTLEDVNALAQLASQDQEGNNQDADTHEPQAAFDSQHIQQEPLSLLAGESQPSTPGATVAWQNDSILAASSTEPDSSYPTTGTSDNKSTRAPDQGVSLARTIFTDPRLGNFLDLPSTPTNSALTANAQGAVANLQTERQDASITETASGSPSTEASGSLAAVDFHIVRLPLPGVDRINWNEALFVPSSFVPPEVFTHLKSHWKANVLPQNDTGRQQSAYSIDALLALSKSRIPFTVQGEQAQKHHVDMLGHVDAEKLSLFAMDRMKSWEMSQALALHALSLSYERLLCKISYISPLAGPEELAQLPSTSFSPISCARVASEGKSLVSRALIGDQLYLQVPNFQSDGHSVYRIDPTQKSRALTYISHMEGAYARSQIHMLTPTDPIVQAVDQHLTHPEYANRIQARSRFYRQAPKLPVAVPNESDLAITPKTPKDAPAATEHSVPAPAPSTVKHSPPEQTPTPSFSRNTPAMANANAGSEGNRAPAPTGVARAWRPAGKR